MSMILLLGAGLESVSSVSMCCVWPEVRDWLVCWLFDFFKKFIVDWLIDLSYHILTNQPLQLAVLAEKPRLLLLQAVDVPDKDVIKVSAKDEMSSEYLPKKSQKKIIDVS